MKIPPLRAKPTQYPTIRVVNPGKGLNNLVSAELIDDHEASDLNNVTFTEAGTVTKGPGISMWGTGLSNNPRGLGSLHTQSGTRQVVTVDGGTVKTTSSAAGTWTAATGATLTPNVPITFTSLRTNPNANTGKDVLYIWDGTTSGCYYDGTTVTRPGTMPSASASIFYNGFHIAFGTTTNTSRLYLSDNNIGQASGVSLSFVAGTDSFYTFVNAGFNVTLTATIPPSPNNPQDVPGATVAGAAGTSPNIIDVNPGDGDYITGLAKFQGQLIIFKKRAIYSLTFDVSTGSPTITLINTYLGAVAHRSIDNVENDVFYLSILGWFTLGYQEGYYTIIRTNELSVRIHPLIATINQANFPQVAAIYQPYWFISAIPTGSSTFNNVAVFYDKRYDAWSKCDYIHANDFTVFEDSSLNQNLLYTDSNGANVWKIDPTISTNNGGAIDAYWQSKQYDGGQPELMKFWIDVTLYFRQINGTVTVTIYGDNNTIIHTSTITTAGASRNGGIAATGAIGTELLGGNSSNNTVGDPFPVQGSSGGVTTTSNVTFRIQLSTQQRTLMLKLEEATTSNFAYLGHALTYRPMSHFVFDSTYIIQ